MAASPSSDMITICQRARPEILAMAGYVSARSMQLPGSEAVFLDANECAFEPFVGANSLARYPAQQPAHLVDAFCRWLDVSSRNLTITRGADEASSAPRVIVKLRDETSSQRQKASTRWAGCCAG